MQSSESNPTWSAPVSSQTSVIHSVNLPFILGVLRRDWLFPTIGCLLGLAAALTYIASAPPMYRSGAKVLIDRSFNRYLQSNKIIDEPVLEESEAGSQIYIIASDSIIIPVVRAMNLTQDPEFVGARAAESLDDKRTVKSYFASIKRMFISGTGSLVASEELLERTAVETLLKRLTVQREDVPNVISVSFLSESATKSADIVNAIIDRYLTSQREAKSESTKMASLLLQERLAELRQQTAEADRMVQAFRINNNLVAVGPTNTADQFTGLSAQHSLARATTAEARARLELVQQRINDGASIPQIMDNEMIIRLRMQHIEFEARVAEIESRVGKDHYTIAKFRKRMDELRVAIQTEQRRLASNYQSEYQLAKARSDQIAANLSELAVGADGTVSNAKVALRELESVAETLRTAYNSVLQRYNSVSQFDDVVGKDARVITRAAPPLHKVTRRAMLALGGGITLGLLLGIGAALGREFATGPIRTPEQIRGITDAYCTVLPRVGLEPARRSQSSDVSEDELAAYVLRAPYSRFTEAFRNARAVLTSRKVLGRGDIIGVVSAVPREGKTTVSTNLAAMLGSNSKLRVLVIDGDLHWRSLTTRLAPDAQEGLIEALGDPSRLSELIVKKERVGIDVLPCPLADRLPDAAGLLGSSKMDTLLATVRELYDFVVIEAPPIMSVVDVKAIEHHIDQFVLVTEWGHTRLRLVEEALYEVPGIRDRLSCVMINKVDHAAFRAIDSYKGPRFGAYYRE